MINKVFVSMVISLKRVIGATPQIFRVSLTAATMVQKSAPP